MVTPPPILVSGPAGSGKSTAAEMIANRAKGHRINVGDLLLNHLQNEGVSPTSRADVGPLFIERHGHEAIAELMLRCLNGESSRIIFDGVRLASTCQTMVAQVPGAQIWFVQADGDTCRRRLTSRLERSGVEQSDIVRYLERASTYDGEQSDIRRMTNVILSNDGSLDSLAHLVDGAVRVHLEGA